MPNSKIYINPKNKGKFNATKKKTGKTTAELTHSSNPTTRKRAIFAQNAAKWHHAQGGFLSPEEIDEYGLGSWLGENIGGLAQVVGGAVLTATGAGAPVGIGMMASGAGSMASNTVGDINKKNQQRLNDQNNEQIQGQNRLDQYNMNNQQSMIPTFAYGGDYLPSAGVYGDGGDVVNGGLNKSSRGYGYNMMAQGGHLPEGNSTLKEAKEFEKLYPDEMKAGTQVEYEHTGNTKLAQRIAADHIKDNIKINQGGAPDYYKKLQMAGISDELNKMPQVMAMGGSLKPETAARFLKEGVINKKPLSDRQKKYFAMIASGAMNKAEGGPIDSSKPPSRRALSDLEVSNAIVKYGYHDDLQAVIKMTPEQRIKLLPPGSPLSYEKVDKGTANSGHMKYYETVLPAQPKPQANTYTDPSQMSIYGQGGLMDNVIGTGYIGDRTTTGSNKNGGIDVNQNPFTAYKGGGSHSENSLGGIPVGKSKVEDGEVRFDDSESGQSYIFSNRLIYKEK